MNQRPRTNAAVRRRKRIEQEVEKQCAPLMSAAALPPELAPPYNCNHAAELIELAQEIEAVARQLNVLQSIVHKHVVEPFESRFQGELAERTRGKQARGDGACTIAFSERLKRKYDNTV